jgi:UDP:flavonoid glycosyltransferase YjiC (YdhE family)
VSRFLFVVPPLPERVRPSVTVGDELAVRGHEVAWTGHRAVVEGLVSPGATVIAAGGATPDDAVAVAAARPSRGLRTPAALILLWDDFLLPLARSMLGGVRGAVDAVAPDVLVVDQLALAGAAVAHVSGVPWATAGLTSAGLADPLWDLPEIARRNRRRLRAFLREAGLDELAAARLDPQASPHLVLAFPTEARAGGASSAADHLERLVPR